MIISFMVPGDEKFYTTDPALVSGSRNMAPGDYVLLPNGSLYHLKDQIEVEFELITSGKTPAGVTPLKAQQYDPRTGKLATT